MKILALELSTGQGSIAWLEDEKAPCVFTFANNRKDSGLFFENMEICVRQFGVPHQIVVGLGPGSYAGVRIAIATALGLRAASAAKLIGIASICGMETSNSDYSVIGDARRASFFYVRVIDRRVAEGPSLHSADELEVKIAQAIQPVFASESLPAFPNAMLAYPSALQLGLLARERPNEMMETEAPEPIYLREPHITMRKSAVFS
jgi:tRNA threonylcarbamoyladenosine biosynthesis protein TsaB